MSAPLEAIDITEVQFGRLDQAGAQLVDLLRLQSRVAAAVTAQLAICAQIGDEIAALDSHPKNHDFVSAMVASEIGSRARINDRAMEAMIGNAQFFADHYPQTFQALSDGLISVSHVNVIQRAGTSITDPELRAGYETAVLAHAVTETTNRLRPIAKRIAEHFITTSLEERHEKAKPRRFVDVTPEEDGMAKLIALLPATEAFAIKDRLSQMAYGVQKAQSAQKKLDAQDPSAARNEEYVNRSISEIRADILTDLLLCSDPTSGVHGPESKGGLGMVQAQVKVIIPVLGLLPAERTQEIRKLAGLPQELDLGSAQGFDNIAGLDGDPQLDGYGPIDSDTARFLAGSATGWDRVMVHPMTGAVLRTDRYQPSKEIRRALEARDVHCRFPGCRMSTHKCDADHTIAAACGGPTALCNLAHLCRRHHTLKHHGRWSVEQRENGTLRWISPNGYVYVEDPPSNNMFKPINTAQRPSVGGDVGGDVGGTSPMTNYFSDVPPF